MQNTTFYTFPPCWGRGRKSLEKMTTFYEPSTNECCGGRRRHTVDDTFKIHDQRQCKLLEQIPKAIWEQFSQKLLSC